MKKSKLLTSLAGIGATVVVTPSIFVACSSNNTKFTIVFSGSNTVASGSSTDWTITLKQENNKNVSFKSLTAKSSNENFAIVKASEVAEGDTSATVTIEGVSVGDVNITLTAVDKDGNENSRDIGFIVKPAEPVYTVEIDPDNQIIEVEQIKSADAHFYCNGEPIEGNIVGAVSLDETKLKASITKDKQQITLMGISYGSSDLIIVAEDTEGHMMYATYTIEVTDIRPYFILKNNNTELWEVFGRNEEGVLHEHKVRDLTDHDIIVTADNLKSTVESTADNDDGNEYCFIINDTNQYDGSTTPIIKYPKNTSFLGTKDNNVSGFTLIHDKTDVNAKLPDKLKFEDVNFTADLIFDFRADTSAGKIGTELDEWILKDCEFISDPGAGKFTRVYGYGGNTSKTQPYTFSAKKVTVDNCIFGDTKPSSTHSQFLLDASFFVSDEIKITNSAFNNSDYNCIQVQKNTTCILDIEDNVFSHSNNRGIRISTREIEDQENPKPFQPIILKNNLFIDCCDSGQEGKKYYMEQYYISGSGDHKFTEENYAVCTFDNNNVLEVGEFNTEPIFRVYHDKDSSWHDNNVGELCGYPDTYLISATSTNGEEGQPKEFNQGQTVRYNCGSKETAEYETMTGDVVWTFKLDKPTWGEELTKDITWKVWYNNTLATSGTTLSWLTWDTSTTNVLKLTISKDVLQSSTQVSSATPFKIEALYTSPTFTHTDKIRSFFFNIQTKNNN